jgi:hypothetical protein
VQAAEPFLKGEGGVMRDLHIREVQYISLHAARPSDELPKKIDVHMGQVPTEITIRKQIVHEVLKHTDRDDSGQAGMTSKEVIRFLTGPSIFYSPCFSI